MAMVSRNHGAVAMAVAPEKFKRAKARRRTEPAKRVTASEEERKAYEDTARRMEDREREHTQFLPDDIKRRR